MLERVDFRAAQREAFRSDVAAGLSAPRKTLPSRWLYDDRGSELFEEITRLPEYYPTRTETGILRDNAADIADFCGSRAVLIEYGAGAGVKTEILLGALDNPALYVPVDIAGDFLVDAANRIEQRFPYIEIRPVVADFTADFDLPADLPKLPPRVAFFPGSTIGNLAKPDAVEFLARARAHVGPGGRMVIGVDLRKDIGTLIRAYDDAAGVTAAFNLNLLERINRELGGDFDLTRFAHEARWNARKSAIEMHLVSLSEQDVEVDGQKIRFAEGETIHTEDSRKYELAEFEALAASAGWRLAQTWTDPDGQFAVLGLA
ncbi:L-histidine N(alpha)-methyltransferase [Chenggangzhangella methanolivorans]|uniref:L-histidine N(Alpha)-methyltransferase n=1 Tax=Chenggangzhangella methanolivorans TaxID=1437009 RepID=A0A9E6UKI8_9HYPH|nr:L-histidine N(alpha)-methyltransferase [Chenggangzhangella methanolivorans]QZN99371.1 L-histidine N(alpha)-methyltransferase [Chenggangzhangella methanolivorans]